MYQELGWAAKSLIEKCQMGSDTFGMVVVLNADLNVHKEFIQGTTEAETRCSFVLLL